MRKSDMPIEANPVPLADAVGRGAPLTDAIECEDGRLLVRARKERAGGMALMVVHEQEPTLDPIVKSPADGAARVKLLFEPNRYRHPETGHARGGKCQVCLE